MNKIITLTISDSDSEIVRENAKLAMIGGVSRIRKKEDKCGPKFRWEA